MERLRRVPKKSSMTQKLISATLLTAAIIAVASSRVSFAGECMFGCCGRPTCGMVCKLVCDTKKVPVPCYGCKCKAMAAPGLIRPCSCPCADCGCACAEDGCGSQCCDACGESTWNGCQANPAKTIFCPSSWFSCCCAKPRTITLLTKRKVERTIPSYHWEVVEGCACCRDGYGTSCNCADVVDSNCPCVYKAAPAGAQIGESIELSAAEYSELAAHLTDGKDCDVSACDKSAISTARLLNPEESHSGIRQQFANLLPNDISAN